MKHILEYRKLFNADQDTDLAALKIAYRNLIKEWHPDKFANDEEKKAEAEIKSKSIIEAYHFLVSISAETHAENLEEYTQTTTTSGIDDFIYKGARLKITFQDGSAYEYFGVPRNVYNKLLISSALPRFARRHIFGTYLYRNVSKQTVNAD